MRVIKITLLCCIYLQSAALVFPQSQGWHNIVPLHSTRKDVEKLLGPPPPPPNDGTRIYILSPYGAIYFLEEGEVHIVYERKDDTAKSSCPGVIPEYTVLLVQVQPKKALQLSDLHLDEKKLKKFDPSTPPDIGFEGYVDEEEGISVRAYKGKVQLINYFGAAKDRHLCPAFDGGPKWFCDILVH